MHALMRRASLDTVTNHLRRASLDTVTNHLHAATCIHAPCLLRHASQHLQADRFLKMCVAFHMPELRPGCHMHAMSGAYMQCMHEGLLAHASSFQGAA